MPHSTYLPQRMGSAAGPDARSPSACTRRFHGTAGCRMVPDTRALFDRDAVRVVVSENRAEYRS